MSTTLSTALPSAARPLRSSRSLTSLLALPLAMALALTLAVLGPATEATAAPAGAPAAAPAGQALTQTTVQRVGKKKKRNRSKSARISRAAGIAVGQLGDPYRWGGTGPSSFDCSGLIYYSFRRAGVSVPRTSSQQARAARNIKKSNMRRGDLMFFHSGGRVYHAGIFLGRKHGRIRMVHAPSTGKRVERSTPWTSRWFAATMRGR